MRSIENPGVVWWLEEAGRSPQPSCPPLTGAIKADVCVVGGGFTGLWAAIELRELAPDLSVALIEREGCGFGASGRNGGWANGWHDELDRLIARFGVEEGLRLADRSSWAVDRIVDFCAEREIDCHLRREGVLWAATSEWQRRALVGPATAAREHGRERDLEEIDGAELRERTGSPLPIEGLRLTNAAAVQPALLVRGLRQAALDLGVQIFEGTPMVGYRRLGDITVETPAGTVTADRLVLALGVYSGGIRELRRSFVPIGTQIVMSEPLGERIRRLSWSRGELFGDTRTLVHYAQVTRDGRIAFGRGGGAIGPSGQVLPSHYHDAGMFDSVAEDFTRWFPQFADARLTHAWGGAVDRAPGHLPFTGTLGDERIVYGLGYSGNGVAPSALVGRILGRRALGIDDEDTRSPLNDGPPGYLPPEPFRRAGGAVVRSAVGRAEAREDIDQPGGAAAWLRPLISFTTPSALEPRLRRRPKG
jgi:glycine/D-amino acid oxidase-like deaminating enzyme